MYQFKEDISRNSFFWFEKNLITNMNWAMLPKASKAVYPVIRSHCNVKGEAYPGEQTTAILSGRTEKIVRAGIRALKDFPGIRFETYVTKRGRSSKRFTCKTPQYIKGELFPFHKDIILGGNWSQLKPISQALYPVMRHFGYNDYYEYAEHQGEDFDQDAYDWAAEFKNRDFDFCEGEPRILCEHANIAYRSYREAVNDLEKHHLIENIGEGKFKVYLHPPMIWKRSWLNKQIMQKRDVEKEA